MGKKENTEGEKRGRGRPKSFADSDAFRKAVEDYVFSAEADGVFPDEAGMRLALKCSKRTVEHLISETENPDHYLEYREVLDWAKDKRESFLVRKMTSDNKAAQGCLNALKQTANGGYIDRPTDSGKVELDIKINGLPSGMSSFK